MRKRPTLASLRAGQTLFYVSPGRIVVEQRPVVSTAKVSNETRENLRRYKPSRERSYYKHAYYTRRQALSAARELFRRLEAAKRELDEVRYTLMVHDLVWYGGTAFTEWCATGIAPPDRRLLVTHP